MYNDTVWYTIRFMIFAIPYAEPLGLLLSAAVSPSKKIIDVGYDVASLARDLDWIAVMTYDYHGHWDKKTGHVSPFYEHPEDDLNYFNTVKQENFLSTLTSS